MITVEDLRFLNALSRTGSLSAAARSLNVTPPAISMRLKKLEKTLGIHLVIRNSRRMKFTAEGEHLVAEAQAIVARIEALPARMNIGGSELRGELRVVAPLGFGRAHVAPLLAEFRKIHPLVVPDLQLSDRPLTSSAGADVAIHIGEMRDSSWVAHLLARNERWVCASPHYLRAAGIPAHPRDLLQHACLTVQENDEDVTLWHFRRKARGQPKPAPAEAVRTSPVMKSNDGEVVRNWAVSGLGCMLRSEWDAAPLIRQGRLQRILAGFEFQSANVVALVPARRGTSGRVDAFIQFLKQQFAPKPPWRI